MNKSIVIIFSIPFIFLFIVGGYFFWDVSRTVQPQETIPLGSSDAPPLPSPKNSVVGSPPSVPVWKDPASDFGVDPKPTPQPPPETQSKIIIKNTDIPVNNFYQNTATRLISEKRDAVLKEDRNYTIDYVATGQSFGISLTGNNLQTSRDVGEQDLLNILGVTKNQACNLNVSVTVPGSVDESAAGVDYGLSFCANGRSLLK